MPLYDIEHVFPLTDDQQERLAKSFTALHSRRFHTPSIFVNVRFTDVSSSQKVYRGGVRRSYNRAILRTRTSETRSREEYGQHCRDLVRAWDEVVLGAGTGTGTSDGDGNEGVEGKQGSGKEDHVVVVADEQRSLRTVWVMGALTTAVEMGVQRPVAGKEIEWLREHKTEFEQLAERGDEDMKALMDELATREDFAGVFSSAER